MEKVKSKIIMLPTEDLYKGVILLRHIWKNDPEMECRSLWQYKETITIDKVKQYTTLNGSFRDSYDAFEPQHLYFTTDEKIKEGDWVYSVHGFVVQVDRISGGYLYHKKGGNNYLNCYKKIIATTDTSLGITDHRVSPVPNFINLPKPPKAFIEKYCKEGGIEHVDIEYINNGDIDFGYGLDYLPLVNSNNEITIYPIKDSWTKENL